jgi:hypothetical protein
MLILRTSYWACTWWVLLYTGALLSCLSASAYPLVCFSLCVAWLLTLSVHGFYWRRVLRLRTPVAIGVEVNGGWLIRARDGNVYRATIAAGTVIWRHVLFLVFTVPVGSKFEKRCVCVWPDSLSYAERRQLASTVALYSA